MDELLEEDAPRDHPDFDLVPTEADLASLGQAADPLHAEGASPWARPFP